MTGMANTTGDHMSLIDALSDAGALDVPLTVEQRQRFIAAAKRGLKWRADRIMGWRIILFTIHQGMGHKVKWQDYWKWADVEWVGPWNLGTDDDEVEV